MILRKKIAQEKKKIKYELNFDVYNFEKHILPNIHGNLVKKINVQVVFCFLFVGQAHPLRMVRGDKQLSEVTSFPV